MTWHKIPTYDPIWLSLKSELKENSDNKTSLQSTKGTENNKNKTVNIPWTFRFGNIQIVCMEVSCYGWLGTYTADTCSCHYWIGEDVWECPSSACWDKILETHLDIVGFLIALFLIVFVRMVGMLCLSMHHSWNLFERFLYY